NEEEKEDMIAMEENCKLRDLPYDTCLQSELPEEANQIFSIAPGEGSKPIPMLTDQLFEELSNPDKFPSGKGGYAATKRDTRLTLSKYVNARLLDQDGQFARDLEYIFGMQYAVEHKQVRDTINIALRQTRGRQQVGRNLDAGMLKNPQLLQNLFKKDRAYSFLKNIRGSPPYWQKMFYEVLAMIRTLGIPTWFLTLSAADMKWPEVIQSIARQYGTIYTEDEVLALPWQVKSKWLRSNPVTAARMFQYRLETFVITFLKSKSNPIGCVTEYVIRIEFQARGSPHAHSLYWIKDAPKIGYSNDKDVKSFIDNYVSCSLPECDEQLRNLVEGLQVHRHSQSCRRKAGCRFKYPKPPSASTLISREPLDNCQQQIDFAVKILTTVKQVLQDKDVPTDVTIQELLTTARVTLDDYTKALSISKSGESIVLKRQPSERNVNCYSPSILRAWQANMDIQYVINAYACVMYIASYVLKAEKGMGELLKQAAKELHQGNTRQQLNKLGSVFLTNREVSAQEAVYRVLSIPLRRCSRTTIFLNTDHKNSRDSLLLPFTHLQKLNDDDENVYCKNIIDRYAARPHNLEDMSLAEFAANYTYKRETMNDVTQCEDHMSEGSDTELCCDDNILQESIITLQNGLGCMRKRRKTAIKRWHNFNIEKQPEKHFRSRIMLFLPWREDKLCKNYKTYTDRYHDEIDKIKKVEDL
ncbi:MAG: helitron helicase-like domain-containing protein, partial [Proteobacteria bacterium]|nr:helitron helicase-like domain-containing protein [Pseudomonadota bacterium]